VMSMSSMSSISPTAIPSISASTAARRTTY
jgi:hypothetical protein